MEVYQLNTNTSFLIYLSHFLVKFCPTVTVAVET